MPIVSMGRVFPREILSPSQIFVNHSKLPVRFIGAFRRIHFYSAYFETLYGNICLILDIIL